MPPDRCGNAADRNVVEKKGEKKLNLESLCIDIQWRSNMKCMVISAIIEATGIVTLGLKKNL
jgi:hypothetical protein